MLSDWLKGDGENSLPPTGSQFGDEDISIFPVPLGVHGEIGMIVVGSERADFPEPDRESSSERSGESGLNRAARGWTPKRTEADRQ